MIDYINSNAGLIGLLFFFSVFIGVALWAFVPSRKDKIESYKYIPIVEDTDDPRR
jgi:cbb3-type cytochrome oxidase subunit 3|tara:strand:+ start:12701 stop:12865 length:165 start_codon:yes stop_codon:yes gene_type:complete